MLLGTVGASLLGDLLTKHLSGKGVRSGKKTVRAGEGFIRAGEGIKKSSNSTTSFKKFSNKKVL